MCIYIYIYMEASEHGDKLRGAVLVGGLRRVADGLRLFY